MERRVQVIISNQFGPLASLKGREHLCRPYLPGPHKVALPACSCHVPGEVTGLPNVNVSPGPFVSYF